MAAAACLPCKNASWAGTVRADSLIAALHQTCVDVNPIKWVVEYAN